MLYTNANDVLNAHSKISFRVTENQSNSHKLASAGKQTLTTDKVLIKNC